jgi:hypothetical protein
MRIAAMDQRDRHAGAHRRDIELGQRAEFQFVAHAAFRYQGDAEASFDQPFLCGQAVDDGDLGVIDAGSD